MVAKKDHVYDLVWDAQSPTASIDGTQYWSMAITGPTLSELKDHFFYGGEYSHPFKGIRPSGFAEPKLQMSMSADDAPKIMTVCPGISKMAGTVWQPIQTAKELP